MEIWDANRRLSIRLQDDSNRAESEERSGIAFLPPHYPSLWNTSAIYALSGFSSRI